ncbi:hypothetical protein [Sphingobium chungangianum]
MTMMISQREMSSAKVDLKTLERDAAKLAEAIRKLSVAPNISPVADNGPEAAQHPLTDPELAALARRLLQESFARERILSFDLFADPAWHIVLDLFASEVEGKSISVSSACIISGAPSTTALRHLNWLSERGAVLRIKDRNDARRWYVRLKPEYAERIRQHLQQVAANRCFRAINLAGQAEEGNEA